MGGIPRYKRTGNRAVKSDTGSAVQGTTTSAGSTVKDNTAISAGLPASVNAGPFKNSYSMMFVSLTRAICETPEMPVKEKGLILTTINLVKAARLANKIDSSTEDLSALVDTLKSIMGKLAAGPASAVQNKKLNDEAAEQAYKQASELEESRQLLNTSFMKDKADMFTNHKAMLQRIYKKARDEALKILGDAISQNTLGSAEKLNEILKQLNNIEKNTLKCEETLKRLIATTFAVLPHTEKGKVALPATLERSMTTPGSRGS